MSPRRGNCEMVVMDMVEMETVSMVEVVDLVEVIINCITLTGRL